MLIVQKFHSIHEIDPEFIPNIELLLQEDVASFGTLVQRHDDAPEGHVFTYFLFFGPTQNTPIGFAQLRLVPIPAEKYIPWYKRFSKDYKDKALWKQMTWEIGDGSSGLCVFDPRFARSGKEKIQAIMKEYEARPTIKATEMFFIKGLQDFTNSWEEKIQSNREIYVLEPFTKASKTYQDYLSSLSTDIQEQIKHRWKALHKKEKIQLGDYPSPLDTPKTLPIPEAQLQQWDKWGAQVLTFEKDLQILGCILMIKGKNGNIFFEPIPFESEKDSLVSDELYTQYAILKFFEMPDARKCHMMKFGSKLVFEEKEDLTFFLSQGFQQKTISRAFYSRLPGLKEALL